MIILLMEQTKAYPERKMEVKFRIGEREEKIAGGELDDPHQSTYPGGARMTRGGRGSSHWIVFSYSIFDFHGVVSIRNDLLNQTLQRCFSGIYY